MFVYIHVCCDTYGQQRTTLSSQFSLLAFTGDPGVKQRSPRLCRWFLFLLRHTISNGPCGSVCLPSQSWVMAPRLDMGALEPTRILLLWWQELYWLGSVSYPGQIIFKHMICTRTARYYSSQSPTWIPDWHLVRLFLNYHPWETGPQSVLTINYSMAPFANCV